MIRAARWRCSRSRLPGLHRVGDVPGYEIPSRFFKFVRTGDARPLEAVMEHNRLDLISLAAVLARAIVLDHARTVGGDDGTGSLRAGARLRARRRLRQRRGVAAEDDRVRAGASAASPKCTPRRCAGWRGSAGAIAVRTKPPKRGTSWRCCRDARRRSGARPRKRSRFITSIASKDLQAARQHALDLLAEGVANPARVQHRLDRLERKLARFTRSASFRLN